MEAERGGGAAEAEAAMRSERWRSGGEMMKRGWRDVAWGGGGGGGGDDGAVWRMMRWGGGEWGNLACPRCESVETTLAGGEELDLAYLEVED